MSKHVVDALTHNDADDDCIAMQESTGSNRYRPILRQLLGVTPSFLICINDGIIFSYTASLLPQLASNSSSIPTTLEEQSWIASLPLISTLIGCLLGGYLMERIGRVRTNQLNAFITIIAWLLIYFAHNLNLLLAGRFLCGLTIGIPTPTNAVFIAEICSPKYRLALLGAIPLGVAVGMLTGHGLGIMLHWQNVALIGSTLPLATLMVLACLHDSPMLALKHGNVQLARKVFYWYRGINSKSKKELTLMIDESTRNSITSSWRDFANIRFFKNLLTINIFFGAMQFSGNKILIFYTLTIFEAILGHINRVQVMLSLDLLRCAMAIIACYLGGKYKVRPLAFYSGYGTAISLLILAISIYYNLAYISVICLISFNVFVGIGILPLPWALCGELFTTNTKGVGSGVTSASNCVYFFAVIKLTPWLSENLGYDGVFALLGGIVLMCTTFLYFLLPETKNRTLHDVTVN